jgi:hypothetical protein
MSHSRLTLESGILLANLTGLGSPQWCKESERVIAQAAWSHGAPAYVMRSGIRADTGAYTVLAHALEDVIPDILAETEYPGSESVCRGTPFGLLISMEVPLTHHQAEEIAYRLDITLRGYLGDSPGKPIRFLVVSPDGHAMREYGVAEHTVLCGATVAAEAAGAPTGSHPNSGSRLRQGGGITDTLVQDFCIVLHSAGKRMDALALMEELDKLGSKL